MSVDPTAQQTEPAMSADPAAQQTDPAMSADPAAQQTDPAMSADPTAQQTDPAMSADPTAQQTEPAMSADPTAQQTDPAMFVDPTAQQTDPAMCADKNKKEPVKSEAKCPHCSETFARSYTLKRHIGRKHKDHNTDDGVLNATGACICHHCGFRCRRTCTCDYMCTPSRGILGENTKTIILMMVC